MNSETCSREIWPILYTEHVYTISFMVYYAGIDYNLLYCVVAAYVFHLPT